MELLKNYNITVDNFLDIGGGVGYKAKEIRDMFGGNAFILEGNADNNKFKSNKSRKAKWNNSQDDFKYYWHFNDLHEGLTKNLKTYTLLDCDNLQLEENLKFDLITSFMSCGFHYPIDTYYQLIKKHSNTNTLLIFDIRKNSRGIELPSDNFKIKNILETNRKFSRCEMELR